MRLALSLIFSIILAACGSVKGQESQKIPSPQESTSPTSSKAPRDSNNTRDTGGAAPAKQAMPSNAPTADTPAAPASDSVTIDEPETGAEPGAEPIPAASPAQEPGAAQQTLPLIPTSDLVVLIAGNDSCDSHFVSTVFPGLVLNTFFEGFIENILRKVQLAPQTEYLFICYEEMSPDMFFYSSRFPQPMQLIHEAQIDSLVASRIQDSGTSTRLTLLGYSYGGWRAIKLATNMIMSRLSNFPVVLVTMDPISRATCQGLFDSGCRDAPADLSPDERMILNQGSIWLNVFQKALILIGSNAVAGAHFNQEFSATHKALPKLTCVWDSIGAFMATYLPPAAWL